MYNFGREKPNYHEILPKKLQIYKQYPSHDPIHNPFVVVRVNSQFEKTRKVSGPRALQPSQECGYFLFFTFFTIYGNYFNRTLFIFH